MKHTLVQVPVAADSQAAATFAVSALNAQRALANGPVTLVSVTKAATQVRDHGYCVLCVFELCRGR